MPWKTVPQRLLSLFQRPTRPISAGGIMRASAREALDLSGCPICRILSDRAVRSLEALLWEQVNDPETHKQLLAARGFCFEHSWDLVVASERVYSHAGIAIMLRRLLDDLDTTADRGGARAMRRWLNPLERCPLCTQGDLLLDGFARELAVLYQSRPSRIRQSTAVPCVLHLPAILNHFDGALREEVATVIAERQRERLATGSTEIAIAMLVGYRPAYLPEAPFRCPACAERHARLATVPVEALTRMEVWSLVDRESAVFDRALAEAQLRVNWTPDDLSPELDLQALLGVPGVSLSGLCLGHLRNLFDLKGADTIWREVLAELRQLASDLERFSASFDYRFHGNLSERERGSWYAVLAQFAGEMPGANLHATAARRSGGPAERLFGGAR